MKKGTAKVKIIQTAKKLFTENGFSNTYVNEIASKTGVSIGTLYYHFPQGKWSILKELGKVTFEEYDVSLKKKGYSIEFNYDTLRDALKALLLALVKLHLDERDFLIAAEAEFLGKIDEYLELRKNIVTQEELKLQTHLFLKPFQELIEKFPEEGMVLEGREKQVFKVLDTLMHRNTFINDTFGTEEEFVIMLTKIVLALLKPDE